MVVPLKEIIALEKEDKEKYDIIIEKINEFTAKNEDVE